MKKNPFEVLGLDPGALNGLTDSQIETLIKGFSNTWQKICHPDVSGGRKKLMDKSIAINEAMEQLDRKKYPKGFQGWRDDFLKAKPVKKKMAEIQRENDNLRLTLAKAYANIVVQLENHFFSKNSQGNVVLRIHNIWSSVGSVRWVANARKSPHAFLTLEIDSSHRIISYNGELLKDKKFLIGSIDEKQYLNIVSPIISDVFDGEVRKFSLLSSRSVKATNSFVHGPMIDSGMYHIIAPYIRYGVVKNGYIVSISKMNSDIFFQVEGVIRSPEVIIPSSS